jgi:virulence-associated protein VapD
LAHTNEIDDYLQDFQVTEVSKLQWKTIDECLEDIRPYNLEKKKLILNINKVLQEYRLYS